MNLKTLAAAYNLYEIEDIPVTHRDIDLDRHKKDIPEFLKTMPNIEVGLFYECKVQDENTDKMMYYIEHSYILIMRKNSINVLMLNMYKDKYNTHPYYGITSEYREISYYLREDAIKDLQEPNSIGVFTSNKVNDWINYCDQYIDALNLLSQKVEDANIKIQKQIDDFISNLPGCKVIRYSNKTWITTSLFEVIFEHNKGEKYLNTKITFKGNLNDITQLYASTTV